MSGDEKREGTEHLKEILKRSIAEAERKITKRLTPEMNAEMFEYLGSLKDQLARLESSPSDREQLIRGAARNYQQSFAFWSSLGDEEGAYRVQQRGKELLGFKRSQQPSVSGGKRAGISADNLRERIHSLEAHARETEGYAGKEKWEKKLPLLKELGAEYEKMAGLSEWDADEDKFYTKAVQVYAEAAQAAQSLGNGKEAGKNYVKAARLSEKLGDEKNVQYFTRRAKETHREHVKKSLDERVKGVYLFLLFLATVFFASPRISGAVTGVSFSAFNYLGIVFFVALLIAVNLKLYARRG